MNRFLVVELVADNHCSRVVVTNVTTIAGRLGRDHETVGNCGFLILHDAHLFVVGARTMARLTLYALEIFTGIGDVARQTVRAPLTVGRSLGDV